MPVLHQIRWFLESLVLRTPPLLSPRELHGQGCFWEPSQVHGLGSKGTAEPRLGSELGVWPAFFCRCTLQDVNFKISTILCSKVKVMVREDVKIGKGRGRGTNTLCQAPCSMFSYMVLLNLTKPIQKDSETSSIWIICPSSPNHTCKNRILTQIILFPKSRVFPLYHTILKYSFLYYVSDVRYFEHLTFKKIGYMERAEMLRLTLHGAPTLWSKSRPCFPELSKGCPSLGLINPNSAFLMIAITITLVMTLNYQGT